MLLYSLRRFDKDSSNADQKSFFGDCWHVLFIFLLLKWGFIFYLKWRKTVYNQILNNNKLFIRHTWDNRRSIDTNKQKRKRKITMRMRARIQEEHAQTHAQTKNIINPCLLDRHSFSPIMLKIYYLGKTSKKNSKMNDIDHLSLRPTYS